MARQRDIAPGRVLPDSSIVQAATSGPTTEAELTKLPVFGGKQQRRRASTWLEALHSAQRLSSDELPGPASSQDGPPPTNRWSDRDPAAAARLTAARAVVNELAEEHDVPAENLLLPDLLRRTCWSPPEQRDVEGVRAHLRAGGAREWQIGLTAEPLTAALRAEA